MCPCDEAQRQPCKGLSPGRGNLSGAAAVLGGLFWIGAHVPQVAKVWRSQDASLFSPFSLFLQLGASFMMLVYSAAIGHFLLALASALSCLAYGFYLVIYVRAPGKATVPDGQASMWDANGEPKLSLELGAMRAGGGGGHGTDAGDTSCGLADDAEDDVI